MNRGASKALFWSPRILGMLFAVFLSVFALDVFGANHGFWQTLLALLIHLGPVYIVILVLAIAWRWEWVGAVSFIALALVYLAWSWGRFHWSAYAAISGTLFLIGLLFLLNWIFREQLRAR